MIYPLYIDIVVLLFQKLKTILDRGHRLPFPDAILINGRGANATTFTFEQGNFSKIFHFYSLLRF
jgi:hypothetical protein